MHALHKASIAALLFAVSILFALSPANAQVTIISVTKPTSYTGYSLQGPGLQAVASDWTETSAYDDVAIDASLFNTTKQAVDGTAYLTTGLGPSADIIATDPSLSVAPTPLNGKPENYSLFSNLSLDANQTYYLVISQDAAGSGIGWTEGVGSPTITTAPGVTTDGGYNTPYSLAIAPYSDFNQANGVDYSPLFTVTGTLVPEPSSLAVTGIGILGLAGLALIARRRKAMQS